MTTKAYNLSLPVSLVQLVDKRAKKQYSSRSEYVKRAILAQLEREELLTTVLDRANAKGKKLGINSEEGVYAMLANTS
ncbi:MAG: ribbon-helix-helix protein, CopG family [Pseudomonadales bacterium]|nr:ribbon-helix-helix protein, CopG family [Candidatus Woesebacteria bacterium]MCB9802060.1 ribbon-helix-helix protein, CopG family [Pseudomonadales bacterium]